MGPPKAECAPVFYFDPFVARTSRDFKFIERVSMLNQRTTANGGGRSRGHFGFREPPVYTGVRMLENLSGSTRKCQKVPYFGMHGSYFRATDVLCKSHGHRVIGPDRGVFRRSNNLLPQHPPNVVPPWSDVVQYV